jgi:lipopolysaccharide biosynthesis regulator YciM
MPTEATFLFAGLLFVAAALGYVFARFGDLEDEGPAQGSLSADYLKGLNYLLNEQPDQALEVFLRMVEVDDETLETHFALGSLYRRRGEIDRAIRIHQNMIARPSLSNAQRDQAMFALAEDYRRAGLLDRAEDIYTQLTESQEYRASALEKLVRIFEQTQDWEQAIEAFARLERMRRVETGPDQVAHYYCELAERARRARDFAAAREHLRKASAGRRRTVRGALARADLAADTDDCATALKLYRRVAEQDESLLTEVIPRFAAMGRKHELGNEFSDFLRDALSRSNRAQSAIAVATLGDPDIDDEFALDCLRQEIVSNDALRDIADFHGLSAGDAESRAGVLAKVRRGLQRLLAQSPGYRCGRCGYATITFVWQCPSCREWESVRRELRIA